MSWEAVKILFAASTFLLVQFGGVVWVARGVSSTADENSRKIDSIAAEQRKRSQAVWTTAEQIKNIEKRQDRMENLLVKIWEKVK